MCTGRTTTVAGRRNKCFTPSTVRVTRAHSSPLSARRCTIGKTSRSMTVDTSTSATSGTTKASGDTLAVYEIDEPNPQARTGNVFPKHAWNLKFPKAPFDCESLFVWKDYGYVVSKVFDKARAQIFRFPLKDTNAALRLELVATTKIESPVTGADISGDG